MKKTVKHKSAKYGVGHLDFIKNYGETIIGYFTDINKNSRDIKVYLESTTDNLDTIKDRCVRYIETDISIRKDCANEVKKIKDYSKYSRLVGLFLISNPDTYYNPTLYKSIDKINNTDSLEELTDMLGSYIDRFKRLEEQSKLTYERAVFTAKMFEKKNKDKNKDEDEDTNTTYRIWYTGE